MNSFIKRTIAAALSLTVTVQAGLPLTGQNRAALLTADAADAPAQQMNTFKAVRINNELAPDGFDENDTFSNPYGKKTMSADEIAEEVYVADMGASGGTIIGENVFDIGSKYRTNTGYIDPFLFTGGNKAITYFTSDRFNEEMYLMPETKYISEICVGLSAAVIKPQQKAKNAVTDHGFTLIDHDLNIGAGAGCGYVYMGYKETTDISKAISDIVIVDYTNIGTKEPPDTFVFEGRTYRRAKAYGYNCEDADVNYGDLNYKALTGSADLYAYYTTDPMYFAYKDDTTKYDREMRYAVTGITFGTVRQFGGARALQLDKDNNVISVETKDIDLNKGAGAASEDTYISLRRSIYRTAAPEGSVLTESSEFQKNNAFVNKTAGGNFDGNTEGKKYHYAMVSFNGSELLLNVTDVRNPANSTGTISLGGLTVPGTDASSSKYKQLEAIGKMNIVTGDFDGNGYDEIAVYMPGAESGSQVAVFTKKLSPNDENDPYPADQMDSWKRLPDIDITPNNDVITLSAGDVNMDGLDDIVIANSTGVSVYRGNADRNEMLKNRTVLCEGKNFSATIFRDKMQNGNRNMVGILGTVRTDDGEKDVLRIMSFASQNEKGTDLYDRVCETSVEYLGIGDIQDRVPVQRELVYANHCFSSPYLSYIYTYQDGKLNASEEICFAESRGTVQDIFTYGYDFTENGSVLHYAYDFQPAALNGSETSVQTVFYKIITLGNITNPDDAEYQQAAFSPNAGKENIIMSPYSKTAKKPTCYAVLNTDNDTAYMTYTGEHWFEYTEPSVLAVISAPPFFKDLVGRDSFSKNSYEDSSTTYGKSEGENNGTVEGGSVYAGMYVKLHAENKVFGPITLGEVEAELEVVENYTWSTGDSDMKEYTVEFSTDTSGDKVVFYSVPYECYKYLMHYYNDEGNEIEVVTRTIYVPNQPCIKTMPLDEYQALANQYSNLPQLRSDLVKHTVGLPETYPTGTGGYENVEVSAFPYSDVGFSNSSSTQSITISHTHQEIESSSLSAIAHAGAGTGNLLIGAVAGGGYEWEHTEDTTKSSSYSGTINDMPAEAKELGYQMRWKMFKYESSYINSNNQKVKFPVVEYMVADVTQPPLLPDNFRQDYINSTQNSIKLNWEFDKPASVAAFNVYRVTNINGQTATALVSTVRADQGVLNEEGTYTYTLIDSGQNQSINGTPIRIAPGSEYEYYIETLNNSVFYSTSISSEKLKAYSHSDLETPRIRLTGLTDNSITVYPDYHSYSFGVEIENANAFQEKYSDVSPNYQWQKKDPTKKDPQKKWVDLSGKVDSTFTITNPSADDEGEYRCRITVIVYDQVSKRQMSETVYSEEASVQFAMRSVKMNAFHVSVDESSTVSADVTLGASADECFSSPSGTVTFTFRNPVFEKSVSVPLLTVSKIDRTSIARLSDASESVKLENGYYQVTAEYSGDKYYQAFTCEPQEILVGDSAVYLLLYNGEQPTDNFYYGDTVNYRFLSYEKDASGTITESQKNYTLLSVQDMMGNETDLSVIEEPGMYQKQLTVQLEGENQPRTFTVSYTVKPRPVTVNVTVPDMIENSITQIPAIDKESVSLVGSDQISDLVTLSFQKHEKSTTQISADAVYKLGHGDYYAKLSKTDAPAVKNYDLKLNSTSFEILPQQYSMELSVNLQDAEAASAFGSIYMESPQRQLGITDAQYAFSAEQNVVLTAVPMKGYAFDHWESSILTEKQRNAKTISLTMPASDVSVKAVFQVSVGTVELIPSPKGTVKTPEGYSADKTYPIYQTSLTFTAEDNENYVFDKWVLVVEDQAADVLTRSITVEVTGETIELRPIFKDAPVTTTESTTTVTSSETSETTVSSEISKTTSSSEISKTTASVETSKTTASSEISKTTASSETSKTTASSEISKTTASSEISKTIASSETSKTTASSEISKTIASSEISKTTASSEISKTTASSETSKTTASSETSKTTASSETSKTTASSEASKTTASPETSKTTASSEISKTTASSETSKTTASSETSKTTASSEINKTTVSVSSESETLPTVSTTGTTISAETTSVTSASEITVSSAASSGNETTQTTAEVTAPERIPGDVNNDGKVNLKDVVMVRRAIAGGWNLTGYNEAAADVNGDGVINLKDVVLIRRAIAGGWNVTLK